MYPIAIEEAWKTHRWALRVFQFLVAVSEVKVKLGLEKIYNNPHLTQIESRKLLVHQLIYNHYLEQESSSIRRSRNIFDGPNTHQLISLPPFTNFCGTQIVKTKQGVLKENVLASSAGSICTANSPQEPSYAMFVS